MTQHSFQPERLAGGHHGGAQASLEPPGPERRMSRALTFVSVLAFGVVVTLGYAYSLPRVYQSTSTLLVRGGAGSEAQGAPQQAASTTAPAETLLGRPLLVNVLASLRSERIGERIRAEHAPDEVAALRSMLSVVEAENANMLELSARGSDRELLRAIVAQWVGAFLEHDLATRARELDSTAGDLATERDVLSSRISEKRRALEEFRRSHDIQSMQREDNVVASRLRGLNEAVNAAEARLAESEGELHSLRGAIDAGQPIGTKQEWRGVVQLEQRLVQLKEQAEELRAKYTQAYIGLNPEMRAVLEQQAVVERELQRKLAELERGVVFAAEQEVSSARENLRTVELELDEHKRKSAEFSARFSEFEALESSLDELEERMKVVAGRLVEEEVSSKNDRPAIEVLEGASRPSFPISPDYVLIAGGGVAGSLLLALAAVWLRDYLSRPDGMSDSPANVYYSMVDARSLNGVGPAALPTVEPQAALPNGASHLLGTVTRELPADEVERLIVAADARTTALIGVLLSGASARQAASLRWGDLSLDTMAVSVGDAARRELPLPPSVRDFLDVIAGDRPADAYVWCGAEGAALPVQELDAMLEYAAEDAMLDNPGEVDTVALRHTHLAYLARLGVDPAALEGALGYLAPSEKVRYRSLVESPAGLELTPQAIAHPVLRPVA